MKVIYNRHFPFGNFWAINILGVVFARSDFGKLGLKALNHEYIHSLQQREMLYIPFYLWYFGEWLVRLVQYRNAYRAYLNISLEREAYGCEGNLLYFKNRKPFSWMRYLRRK